MPRGSSYHWIAYVAAALGSILTILAAGQYLGLVTNADLGGLTSTDSAYLAVIAFAAAIVFYFAF